MSSQSTITPPARTRRLSAASLGSRKGGVPIVMLTAYTARMATLLDRHCDIILVGDSLAQVVYGLPSTTGVTLDIMIAHGAAAVRGSSLALVVVDMPFGSYEESPEQAFRSASRVLKETGAGAVKLEGGESMASTIAYLRTRGVPVMAHIGLTPQAINVLGGYGARGREDLESASILRDAVAVDKAGAFAIVVEAVVKRVADNIINAVSCPTIGIGASPDCDGQVLVTDDMLGMFDRTPRFVRRFEEAAVRIEGAIIAFADAVRTREFPDKSTLYE